MTAFRTSAGRIVLAIFVSVLIHAIILWLPYLQLPQAQVRLPPFSASLAVRLENVPKAVEQIPAATPPVKQRVDQPELAEAGSTQRLMRADKSAHQPAIPAMSAMKKTEEATTPHTFPTHLRLTFIVYKSADGLRTGEIHHQLDMQQNRYTLKSIQQTAGIPRLHNNDQLIRTSRGKFGTQGFQPDIFEEEKISGNHTQRVQATFDWPAQELRYSNGRKSALPAGAQDALSFMYQISQLALNGEFFPQPVSDGTSLEQYRIEIGAKENIATPMGELRTLHLRKMHGQGEAYFEIWLGLEYRRLPVKFREVDNAGNLIQEFVVASIRTAND